MNILIDTDELKAICTRENIKYLGLFGSYARGEAHSTSDVDVLIDFVDTKSYFQLAKVQEELEDIFKRKVDLVLRSKIKVSLKPYILKDLMPLYEKK